MQKELYNLVPKFGICQEGNENFFCEIIDKVINESGPDEFLRYLEIGTAYGETIRGVKQFARGHPVKRKWQFIGCDIEGGWSLDVETAMRNGGLEKMSAIGQKWNMGGDYLVLCDSYSLLRYRWNKEEKLSLALIDACHCFNCVKQDFESVAPLVKPGGIILFHDFEADHLDGGKPNENHGKGIEVTRFIRESGLEDDKVDGWKKVGVSGGNWKLFGIQKKL